MEAALLARSHQHGPQRYLDPVELGSLIVSIASLAWMVYASLKKETSKPAPKVVIRAVRVQIRSRQDPTAPEDEITDIVVNEIMRTAEDRQ